MFMYLIGPVFALGLIVWVNRDMIRAFLNRGSDQGSDPKDDR